MNLLTLIAFSLAYGKVPAMPMEYKPNPKELASLKKVRELAWKLLYDTADMMKPGMNEEEARKRVQDYFKKNGVEKNWHAPKIRFGTETLKNFSGTADQSVKLKDSDIFFLDYGPVIDGFEADVGDTFVLGNNPDYLHLQKSAREIFKEVEAYWRETKSTGPDLFEFGKERARLRNLVMEPEKAGGHMISEFPHQLKYRGPMRKYEDSIIEGVWVMEVQLTMPETSYGAFYEDLLINQ